MSFVKLFKNLYFLDIKYYVFKLKCKNMLSLVVLFFVKKNVGIQKVFKLICCLLKMGMIKKSFVKYSLEKIVCYIFKYLGIINIFVYIFLF